MSIAIKNLKNVFNDRCVCRRLCKESWSASKESEHEDEEGESQSVAVCRIFELYIHVTNIVLASAVNMKVDLSRER